MERWGTSGNMKRKYAIWAGASVLTAALWAVCFNGEWFTKLKAGPLFALECVFLACIAAAALSGSWRGVLPGALFLKDKMLASLPFVAWGLGLLSVDLTARSDQIVSLQRVLQHALIFVYPMMWIVIGLWLGASAPRIARGLVFGVAAINGLQQLFRHSFLNVSLGPVPLVLLMLALNELLNLPLEARRARGQGVLPGQWPLRAIIIATLAFAAFMPVWRPWWSGTMLHRSVLGMMAVVMVSVPAVLNFKDLRRGLAPFLAASGIFLLGIGAGTFAGILGDPSSEKVAVQKFYQVMQHGEDLVFDEKTGKPVREGPLFAFRDRAFWWSRAFAQWRSSPMVGIGFIPEVPDRLRADVKNDGIFENGPDFQGRAEMAGKPVSGPHNSYLSILARMGLVGLALFLFVIGAFAKAAYRVATHRELGGAYALLIIFIPVHGLVYALFQTGLESPRCNVILWTCAGLLFSLERIAGQGERENQGVLDPS